MSKGNGLEAGKWATALNARGLMTWLFAHQADVSETVRMCVRDSLYVCSLGVSGGGGGWGCWSHLSVVIKAGAVVTKLSPYARLLSAAAILRERQTHYREGREKQEERLGEREREGGGQRSGGVSRPVAEGLILNVLQRQCLLSSLASPLTAPASKQDLSPLPPPDRKRGRKQERRRLLKMTALLLPRQTLSSPQKVAPATERRCHVCSFPMQPDADISKNHQHWSQTLQNLLPEQIPVVRLFKICSDTESLWRTKMVWMRPNGQT